MEFQVMHMLAPTDSSILTKLEPENDYLFYIVVFKSFRLVTYIICFLAVSDLEIDMLINKVTQLDRIWLLIY